MRSNASARMECARVSPVPKEAEKEDRCEHEANDDEERLGTPPGNVAERHREHHTVPEGKDGEEGSADQEYDA